MGMVYASVWYIGVSESNWGWKGGRQMLHNMACWRVHEKMISWETSYKNWKHKATLFVDS